MKKVYWKYVVIVLLLTVSACKDKEREAIVHLVEQWQGRKILFPDSCAFTVLAKDTVPIDVHAPTYKVLVYIDSVGCTGCRLQLPRWQKFIAEIDSMTNGQVSFLFFLSPKNMKDARFTLKRDNFTYPLCIDLQNRLNQLNKFPAQDMFQTFLLNKENRVIAVGNPVHNRAIRSLYVKELTGIKERKSVNTIIDVPVMQVNLGTLKMGKGKRVSFTIKNVGSQPLVIYDVVASCGCTKVEYDKKPVLSNNETDIQITYTADERGSFRKTVTVYCNAAESPLYFKIEGDVR